MGRHAERSPRSAGARAGQAEEGEGDEQVGFLHVEGRWLNDAEQ